MPENEKLIVAPFNKKEIEKISVEATKRAIEEGDIPLPPSGTKLYLHSIDAGSMYPEYSFVFISAANNAGRTNEDFIEICKKAVNGNKFLGASTGASGSLSFLNVYTADGNTSFFIDKCDFTLSNNTITKTQMLNTSNLLSYNFFSHTVTEL